MRIYYQQFATPLGTMLVAGYRQALTGCYFVGQKHFPKSFNETPRNDKSQCENPHKKKSLTEWILATNDPLLSEAQQIIEAYFHSGVLHCPIELAPQGTNFQRQVWNALLAIPAGQTRSYSQIATAVGNPSATRAVAGAIGRNPIGIIIPCHRVIGSDGSLTGYAGGIERKQALLQLEGVLPAAI